MSAIRTGTSIDLACLPAWLCFGSLCLPATLVKWIFCISNLLFLDISDLKYRIVAGKPCTWSLFSMKL
jgi:hypothetical protein